MLGSETRLRGRRSRSLLLTRPVLPLQEEDEVPDDETVNQMIARSEEEFEQFMVGPRPRLGARSGHARLR